MARQPLYSASHPASRRAAAPEADPPAAPAAAPRLRRLRAFVRRRERWLWTLVAAAAVVAAGWPGWTHKAPPVPTMKQIDFALRESIAKEQLQSAAAAAYATVLPSVVRVVGEHDEVPPEVAARMGKPLPRDPGPANVHEAQTVGTGVVIVDSGLILTNLHVVDGASRIKVTFMLDGNCASTSAALALR